MSLQPNCSCDPKKIYIGQTRVNIATRMKQHKTDVESKKLDAHFSGISKHARSCTTGHWVTQKLLKFFKKKTKITYKET